MAAYLRFNSMTLARRRALRAGVGFGLAVGVSLHTGTARGQSVLQSTGITVGLPPKSSPLWRLMNQYAKGQTIQSALVSLEIPELVETGNSVQTRVRVQSPMSATQFVQSIILFNELNPVNDIIEVALSANNPVAEIETRIKLANSQWVVAMAKTNDGQVYAQGRQVVVTLGSCVG